MKNASIDVLIFVSGAVIMMLELTGTRLFSPFFGNSVYVWTSIIGVILASLSLGYWIGGKLADKHQSVSLLVVIVIFSSIWIGFIEFAGIPILKLLTKLNNTLISSILASSILFSVPSILLAMISPYSLKLKINNLEKSGLVFGNISALSTIGSIFGTFFTGFYLLPSFGTNKIFFYTITILLFLGILIHKIIIRKSDRLFFLLIVLTILNFSIFLDRHSLLTDNLFHSQYDDIQIKQEIQPLSNKRIILLQTGNNAVQSGMFMDNPDELVNQTLKYFSLIFHFNPNLKSTLLLGGGAYSFPKYYIKQNPNVTIDVVEIDPMMTRLAKTYFNLKDDPRINIYHEDARYFLNSTNKKYDAIIVDVFVTSSIPYQVTTNEAIKKMYSLLNDNGVIMMNLVSSIEGEKSRFLRAEYRTFSQIFPQVYIFPFLHSSPMQNQNIILAAIKSEKKVSFNTTNPEFEKMLLKVWKNKIQTDIPILTDDYAPVEFYELNRLLKE